MDLKYIIVKGQNAQCHN